MWGRTFSLQVIQDPESVTSRQYGDGQRERHGRDSSKVVLFISCPIIRDRQPVDVFGQVLPKIYVLSHPCRICVQTDCSTNKIGLLNI
jgi:hypothetical protein